MLKEVVFYREENFWTWKIVDAGDRETFPNDKFLTRNDALFSLLTTLKSMQTGIENRKNKPFISV
jgi:hypothetical protein